MSNEKQETVAAAATREPDGMSGGEAEKAKGNGKMRVSKRIMALADALYTAPCRIADTFGVNPFLVERLLHLRGQRCLDGETLIDCIARHYGDAVACESNECIHVDAWEDAK